MTDGRFLQTPVVRPAPLATVIPLIGLLLFSALQFRPAAQTPAAAAACPKPPDEAFGTTTKTELSLEGKIYFLPERAEKLPDFAKEKSQGSIFTDRWDIASRD